MKTPVLTENSMYKDAAGRASIVADPKLAVELFFINFLGFLGLYALNDSRGYMKTHETTEKKLRIGDISDENHDSSLAVKLCVDAGILSEGKATPITKFLSLIKQRTVRAKDVDSVRVRDMISATQLHTKPMGGALKAVVSDFMDGKIDVKEYSRLVYDCSKTAAWRDFTLEFRTIVLKGQYTDYFTVMKRTVAAGPAAAPAAPPAYVPPVVTAPIAVAAPATVAPAAKLSGFNPTKMWVDCKGDLADMNKAMVAGKFTKPANIAAFDSVDLEQTKLWPVRDHIGKVSLGDEFRRKVIRKSIEGTEFTNEWDRMRLSLSTNHSENDAILRLLVTASANLDPAWVASHNASHTALATLIALMGNNSAANLESVVNSKLRLASPNHNAWLLSTLIPGVGGVHTVKAAGREAVKWVSDHGKDLRPLPVKMMVGLTGVEWINKSAAEKLEWVLSNWTAAGSASLSKVLGNGSEEMFTSLTWAQVKTIVKTANIDNWSDRGLWSMISLMTGGSRTYYVVGAMCGLEEIAAGDGLSGTFHSRTEFLTKLQALPWAVDAMKEIASLELTTATQVTEFVDAMNNVIGGQKLSVAHDFFNLAKGAAESRVAMLPWVATASVAGLDHVTFANPEYLIATTASAEVRAWVKEWGAGMRPVMKVVAERTAGETPASAYMKGVMRGESSDFVLSSLTPQESNALSMMSQEDWRAVAKTVGDVMVKTDKNFMDGSSLERRAVFAPPYHLTNFPEGLAAARQYIINEHPSLVRERRNITEVHRKSLMLPPMTKEKLNLLLSVSSSMRVGLVSSYDGSVAIQLLESLLKDVKELWDAGPVLQELILSAKGFDVDATIAAMKTVPLVDNKELRLPLMNVFDSSMQFKFPELNSPDLYDVHRWAWGISLDDLKKVLTEGSTYAGATRVYSTFDYTAISGAGSIAVGFWPNLKPYLGDAVFEWAVARNTPLPIWIWGAEAMNAINIDKYTNMSSLSSIALVVKTFDDNDPDDAALKKVYATKFIPAVIDKLSNMNIHNLGDAGKAMVLAGGDTTIVAAKINACIKYTVAAPGTTVVEIATAVRVLTGTNLVGMIDRDAMITMVGKLSKSTSKASLEAIPMLAFTDDKASDISPLFIEAVRAARCERSVINRVVKGNAVQQALGVVNADPNGVKLDISGDRLNTFLKFNDIDVSALSTTTVTKLEDLAKAKGAIAAIVPPLAMTDISSPAVNLDRTRILHRNNKYNHGKELGMEVKRTFTVDIKGQKDRFDAWVKAHPSTRILTLYHGTGTINAAFILRFGFKIIKSTDASVTGRMLGDGIYFADNINKSMLYMSNAGYVREAGQEGYVMKCKVALGQRPKDNREGNKERSGLISNEWSIFNLDQIVIEEAYYGFSRWKQDVRGMLNEDAYMPNESNFMFMDGRVPVTATETVDFENLVGDHISIEYTAKGPIVCIRHDKTVDPIDRCYRWGEELQEPENKKELDLFLKLISNRY